MFKEFGLIDDVFKKQKDASYMLETLVSDLLDLAKIDNNQFKLNLEYYNLVETIKKSL